jgi:glutamate/tyrosine decarboxylase-like PLP-dependent enzyme
VSEQEERLRFIEPDGSNREEVRRLGYRFVDLLVDAASHADARPPVPDELPSPELLSHPYSPPAAGRGSDDLLQELKGQILDRVLNPAHPGYVGHMDSLASAVGIFSDAIVSACNNNMLSYEMSLLFTGMEKTILDWAARSFGWGDSSRGFLVSGGTLANIQAIWAARNYRGGEKFAQEGIAGAGRPPVFIASESAHYSFIKAANLLGIGREGFLRVPCERGGRVDAKGFETAIERAESKGLRPFCLVGVAGTTVTGTIEPLEEIGEIARRHGLWFHVDAAYGGSLFLSQRHRSRLRGCEMADSITWNPQKWLYVPKTCASILFRDGSVLDHTVREQFVYGREDGQWQKPNLGEYTIQGTRRVDVLKLWLTLEHFGTDYLGGLIDLQIERAGKLARRIAATPGLELTAEPDLNIVCFRVIPDGIDQGEGERLDRIQAQVQREVAHRGHGWLSMPSYRGRRVLRAVILHPRCDDATLERLLSDVLDAAREAKP